VRSGAELGERERQLLDRFLELLYSDGERLNLTRVPRAEAGRRHIQEALDLVPLRNWSPGERVLDLGSGGGLPGIPLAIALPAVSMTLMERDRAKAAFLLSCLGQLGLGSVRVAIGDAGELAARPGFQPAQVLVSRAAVPAPRLLRLAGALLAPGAEALVHVGASVVIDTELGQAAARAGLEGLRLERSGDSRVLRFRRAART
jgi:16S rRNA (guanine527-N7)-methyltransferase